MAEFSVKSFALFMWCRVFEACSKICSLTGNLYERVMYILHIRGAYITPEFRKTTRGKNISWLKFVSFIKPQTNLLSTPLKFPLPLPALKLPLSIPTFESVLLIPLSLPVRRENVNDGKSKKAFVDILRVIDAHQ